MVIRPALTEINFWSRSAEELVLGTAIVESGLTYLKQYGDGPALGADGNKLRPAQFDPGIICHAIPSRGNFAVAIGNAGVR